MSYELAEQGKQSISPEVEPLLSSKNGTPTTEELPPTVELVDTKMQALQLLFGAGGIYAAFLYYGSLQEDVFRYESENGEKFKFAWYLQVLESLANVVVGTAALVIMGFTGTGYSSADDLSAGKTKYWGGTPNVSRTINVSKLYIQLSSNNFYMHC